MSNSWVNIRVGTWHLQIGPDEFAIRKNGFWVGQSKSPVAVYQFFGLERWWEP